MAGNSAQAVGRAIAALAVARRDCSQPRLMTAELTRAQHSHPNHILVAFSQPGRPKVATGLWSELKARARSSYRYLGPASALQQMTASDQAAAVDGEAAAAAAAATAAPLVPASHPWGGTSLQQLRSALQQFAAERDWGQYHTPRNLVLALVGACKEGGTVGMGGPAQLCCPLLQFRSASWMAPAT